MSSKKKQKHANSRSEIVLIFLTNLNCENVKTTLFIIKCDIFPSLVKVVFKRNGYKSYV